MNPANIANLISENVDEPVNGPEPPGPGDKQYMSYIQGDMKGSTQSSDIDASIPRGKDGSIVFDASGFNSGTISDTLEEIFFGPYSADAEVEIAYNYEPGEPMVRYYSDGSGYPGSPDHAEFALSSISEINVYDEQGDTVCTWNKKGDKTQGDCSVITKEFVKQIENHADEYIQDREEALLTDVGEKYEGGRDDYEFDSYRGRYDESKQYDRAQLELIAGSDPSLFESILNKAGYKVIGRKDSDPLRTEVQSESVDSVASMISESVDDRSNFNMSLLAVAELHGYIVEA
jgi:hypothetical protein